MKKFYQYVRKLFSRPEHNEQHMQDININAQIETVKLKETEDNIEPGRRIHYFPYLEFELQLDRDIIGLYRLVVNEGQNRRYSFTINCKQRDYESLRSAFEEIIQFLDGDRRIANLPNHDRLEGHYYGS